MDQRNPNDRRRKTGRHLKGAAARFAIASMLYVFCSLGMLVVLASPLPCTAQTSGIKPEDLMTKYPDLPWRLKADELTYDQKAEVYIARGNVEITKADKKLTADYIRFDHKNMQAFASGNVILISGQDVIKASSISIDLETQVGSIQNGTIFLKENNYHIKGDNIQKTGENTYEIDKAVITTCDGDKPDWRIKGRDVKVTIEGYGSAKHATLWAGDVPVFYTPYFYYPAKKKRQTGFLFPEFGYSKRKGGNYNQPFFWAISDSQDATFYGNYMVKRGIKPGLEYRYILSESTHGAIMLDGMHDDKVDETATGTSAERYGFDDPGVQLARSNHDRWWFRMSHHQKAPWDFNAKLDLDLVSDQDYLREFPDGYMGFEGTQNLFTKFFGRQLDDYNDPIRLNRLNFNRIWLNWNINAELRYFLDATQDNTDLPDTTISRLPVVDIQRPKRSLFKSPFYFDLDSNYNYFWRPSGSRGQRIDVHPRLYYPYQFENYFTFEPSAGVRETVYYLDAIDENDEFDRTDHRELFDLRLDFFSDVYRVINIDAANIQKIRHSIRPQIVYDYIPEVSQSDMPEFDSADRIDKQSTLTYSLTNTLTSKLLAGGVTKLADRKTVSRGEVTQAPDRYDYKDFLRLELLQNYDFLKSNKEFSPIGAKLDLFPGQYISIDADTAWSVYGDGFVSHNIGTAIWDKRGDRLYVDYRYDKGILVDTDEDEPNVQSIFLDLNLKVNNKLSVFGNYERNIEESLHIRTSLGFKYNSQCWSFNFRYVEKPEDRKYEFKINLHGLGGIGF